MLKVTGLTVEYGGITALRKVDVTVDEDELVVIVGANGAGKSSLFKAISGVIPISGGRIEFDGHDLRRMPPHRRARLGIAHVPEGRHVFGPLSVEENLVVGAMGARDVSVRLDVAYALFPTLAERRTQAAGHLSGGQQQMVALGRALMARPRLMLIDEPSMGLAPAVVEQVFGRIASITEGGTSALLVEQRADIALDLAQRGYVLNRGRIALKGTAESLRSDDRVREAYLGEAQ